MKTFGLKDCEWMTSRPAAGDEVAMSSTTDDDRRFRRQGRWRWQVASHADNVNRSDGVMRGAGDMLDEAVSRQKVGELGCQIGCMVEMNVDVSDEFE